MTDKDAQLLLKEGEGCSVSLEEVIQLKMSPHARKFIFKTLYVIAGMLSVFGALGTTGVLMYKYRNSQRPEEEDS